MKRLLLFAISVILTLGSATAQQNCYSLTQWRFTCPDPSDTAFTTSGGASVPGCIHTDLLAHGLISDPFYGTNEDSLQWLSDAECTYTIDFWKQDLKQKKNLELVLEGITGYAEIFLNGEPLMHQDFTNIIDNAYRSWHFPLDGLIRTYNFLEVRFTPARRIINERKAALPYALPDDRVFLRNPPYQAGWDWGPKLTTSGITGNAYIQYLHSCHVRNLNIQQTGIAANSAQLILQLWVECSQKQTVDITYFVNNQVVDSKKGVTFNETGKAECYENRILIDNPKLWWPNGNGEQNLYEVAVVVSNKHYSDTIRQRIGLRNIELRQEPDAVGQSFEFVINKEPIFMKGVNWIPADFFTQNMTEEHYRELLQACKDANMNMIRIWGGGIYEPDIFYDLCDEMGILVWQDFMYACALYPGDADFMQKAEKEAVEQIIRLRHHPCIAVWCGNNEVKNGWEDWGWQSEYTPEQRAQLDHDLHYLFDTLLARNVADFGHHVPYVSTSPLWGWGHPECCTEGDSHYWGVWWGEQPFEMWHQKVGRFMSEFGFQSYPDLQTLKTVIPADQLQLGSPAMNSHQKHSRGVQIINKAMDHYFYRPENLEDYIYVSQLVQAFGTGMALEVHRRSMPYCMGTLFWQLNDCCPVASWSCIDYYSRRKALYYEAKRQFEPIIIACDTIANDTLPIYLVNDGNNGLKGSLQIELRDFAGTILSVQSIIPEPQKPHTSSLLYQYVIPSSTNRYENYLSIHFVDENGNNITDRTYFFAYPGELKLVSEEDNLSIKMISEKDYPEIYKGHENEIALWVSPKENLQYGVELKSDTEGTFSDNFFTAEANNNYLIYFTPKDKNVRRGDIKIWGHSFNELKR